MERYRPDLFIDRVKKYFNIYLWDFSIKTVKGPKQWWYRFLRVCYLTLRGLYRNKWTIRASALTFYSLMSLVPVLAMTFAIAKGFGYQNHLQQELLERFQEQKVILKEIFQFAHNVLSRTRGGVIAFVGVAILAWSVIKVLSHIESSFNNIWGVIKPRQWRRKLSDYFAMMVIGPFFFIISSSVTVYIVTTLEGLVGSLNLYETVSNFLSFWIRLFPYGVIWILFTILYIFMPNTKVRILPALIGGIIAGTVYQLFQWSYIYFQIGVSRYGAIYGSFAALPLFLIWLQLSWLTVLGGAEISYACQNSIRCEFQGHYRKMSHHLKVLLCLWIMHQVIHRFIAGQSPISKTEIHESLEAPFSVIDDLTQELCDCGLLSKICCRKSEKHQFQPARSPELLKVQDVIDAIEQKEIADSFNVRSKVFSTIKHTLKTFHQKLVDCPENQKLMEIHPDEGTKT